MLWVRTEGLVAPKEEPAANGLPSSTLSFQTCPRPSLSFPSRAGDVSSPQEGHRRFSSYPPTQGEVCTLQGFSLRVAGSLPSALGLLETGVQKWEGRAQRASRWGRGQPPGAQAARCCWRFAQVEGRPERLQAPWVHSELRGGGGLSL